VEEVAKEAMSKFESKIPFSNLFGKGVFRKVIPFESPMKESVEYGVKNLGYDGVDWQNGEAYKNAPPHEKAPPGTLPRVYRVKLGKVLGRFPDPGRFLKWWSENQGEKGESGYSIVISRHPVDVVRMSDHDTISSCHSPGGSYWESCVAEMKHGGLVAYLVPNKDLAAFDQKQIAGKTEIFDDPDRDVPGAIPLSRVRLRRFTHESGDFDLALPELRTYGQQGSTFQNQVETWAKTSQQELLGGKRLRMKDFVRRGGSYSDNSDGTLFNEFFGDHLDHGNTGFGVSGKEGADLAEQRRTEIEEMNTRWNQQLKYSSVYYEEFDEQEEGEELRFYWNGSTAVEIPSNLFPDLNSLPDYDDLGRGKGSLREELSDNGFYLSGGDINVDTRHGSNSVFFYLDVNDSDGGFGDPDEFNNFCQELYDDWDQKNEELKKIIISWLIENEFIHQTPVRQSWESLPQFQNFEVELTGGDLTASVRDSIGSADAFYKMGGTAEFKGFVVKAIRKLVFTDLQKLIVSRKSRSGYLPGFEPEQPVREVYDINRFKVDVGLGRVSGTVDLKIDFEASDLTSQDEMEEIVDLLRLVDRMFPAIIQQCAVWLANYSRQVNEYVAKDVDSPHAPAFKFDPNLQARRARR
jgi:hypothetical protein